MKAIFAARHFRVIFREQMHSAQHALGQERYMNSAAPPKLNILSKRLQQRYPDATSSARFQMLTLTLVYLGICLGFGAVAILSDAPPRNRMIFTGMFLYTVSSVLGILLGHFATVRTFSLGGFWAGFTLLVFSSRQLGTMEIHHTTVYYMAMIFVSALLLHQRHAPWILCLLSLIYIWVDYIYFQNETAGNSAISLDDYIGISVMLTISIAAAQYLVFQHSKQLNAAIEEADYQSEQATELIRLNAKLKSNERELKALRDYLSAMFDSMPSMLISVDANCDIVKWNRETEKQLAGTIDTAVGKSLEKTFPQFAQQAALARQSILENRTLHSLPVRIAETDADGHKSECYRFTTVFPINTKDISGAVIRLDDVTEQVKMQEMIVHTEKMMSVGGLAAGMAHEINNPLGGILQNIAVIQNRLTKKMPPNEALAKELNIDLDTMNAYLEKRQIFKMIEMVNESGQRAAKIVHNMLSFSRKGSGSKMKVELCDLVKHTLNIAETEFDLKKNFDFKKIKINLECSRCPSVTCETTKIQQVLLNILRNGAEAMQEAYTLGSIRRKPEFDLHVYGDAKDEWVTIEIRDNGPGMEDSVRRRIFEPFFTTREVGSGTGLGLSVSYFIVVENHHGHIDVKSEKGEGTTFYVRLPVHSPEAASAFSTS